MSRLRFEKNSKVDLAVERDGVLVPENPPKLALLLLVVVSVGVGEL